MKVTALILLAILGVVLGEYCSHTDSNNKCGHVQCSSPQVPTCENHYCACGNVDSDPTCITAASCGTYFTKHYCIGSHRHCIDSKCRCQ